MQCWWVNQNQTHRQEIGGGYMWSPKTDKNGHPSHFYDNMTHVRPGDVIFSFYQQEIGAMGIATSSAYSEPKPEFGNVGVDWNNEGWMVNVDYEKLENKIAPKVHISEIIDLLPSKYSPLKSDGKGNQAYLFSISEKLASKLISLIGDEAATIINNKKEFNQFGFDEEEFESERIKNQIINDDNIPDTEKETLIKARKGQGKFRENVIDLHKSCPITGVTIPEFLVASHIKPWSKCENNFERLDPNNGLPLTPVADRLFDRGKISFLDNGELIYTNDLNIEEIKKMGIDLEIPLSVDLNSEQIRYMTFHRNFIYKG